MTAQEADLLATISSRPGGFCGQMHHYLYIAGGRLEKVLYVGNGAKILSFGQSGKTQSRVVRVFVKSSGKPDPGTAVTRQSDRPNSMTSGNCDNNFPDTPLRMHMVMGV